MVPREDDLLASCPASPLLLLLLAGCATTPPDEAAQSPQRTACAGVVKQMQASCNPDLLRTQGGDCSAAAARVVDHCDSAR